MFMISTYVIELGEALRKRNVKALTDFFKKYVKQGFMTKMEFDEWNKCDELTKQKAMWKMIYERTDLADLHDEAFAWLIAHGSSPLSFSIKEEALKKEKNKNDK